MGRHLREEGPETVHFITNRCFQRRFLLKPSPRLNAIVLGCLAWAAHTHQVRLFCYVFMSNHFHLLAQAPRMNMSDFMGSFKAELARRINQLYGRSGTAYAGRFRSRPVFGEAAQREKMRYILSNPVAAGLVTHPSRWPGVSSWEAQMSDDEATRGRFILMKEYRPRRRKDPGLTLDEARIPYRLELARLPGWEGLDQQTYRARLRELVDSHCEALADEIRNKGRRFLGARRVMAQHWSQRARSSSEKTRPLCHTRCPRTRRDYRAHVREVRARYLKAAAALYRRRRGAPPAFPYGTYPPGRSRCVGRPRHPDRAA